jgi:putative PIN family toxin of toxin-antitoxin system
VSIVLDTNVLVSGLLRAAGPPGRILDLVASGVVRVALDERIFAEYCDVLSRSEFDFAPARVLDLTDYLWRAGDHVQPTHLDVVLPDPDDVKSLEAAVARGATALVTGNMRHYPPGQRRGVRLVTPREWLATWLRE